MGFKLDKEQDLGVIVKKHESGIRETNKGEKYMDGNIGDTLMRRVDRTTYLLTKEEVAERKAAAKPETAAAKKAREAAEAAMKSAESGSVAPGAENLAALDLSGADKGKGANGIPGEAGAAE